tara:strand:+ start:467 stop:817 length:351 start_codon:yes stop_codon:yes gene_type:complete
MSKNICPKQGESWNTLYEMLMEPTHSENYKLAHLIISNCTCCQQHFAAKFIREAMESPDSHTPDGVATAIMDLLYNQDSKDFSLGVPALLVEADKSLQSTSYACFQIGMLLARGHA